MLLYGPAPQTHDSSLFGGISQHHAGSISEQVLEPKSVPPPHRQCRLEWQRRGGRAGEDWVVLTGVMVADASGYVVPLHQFLRNQINLLVKVLSCPARKQVTLEEAKRAVRNVMADSQAVIEHPIQMPQNYAAVSATAMLWGNFCDACVAVVNVTFSGKKDTILSFDAHTLGVVSPRVYALKRAPIEGAVPCNDYYAVSAPDSQDRAWTTTTDDNTLAPSVLWALQNALNCQFPGSAASGKAMMREWLSDLGQRFILDCADHGINRSEITALAANQLNNSE